MASIMQRCMDVKEKKNFDLMHTAMLPRHIGKGIWRLASDDRSLQCL